MDKRSLYRVWPEGHMSKTNEKSVMNEKMKVNETSLKLHELSLDAVWEKRTVNWIFCYKHNFFLMIIWELFESTDSLRSWEDFLLNV